jgi:hypothetical protein
VNIAEWSWLRKARQLTQSQVQQLARFLAQLPSLSQ